MLSEVKKKAISTQTMHKGSYIVVLLLSLEIFDCALPIEKILRTSYSKDLTFPPLPSSKSCTNIK